MGISLDGSRTPRPARLVCGVCVDVGTRPVPRTGWRAMLKRQAHVQRAAERIVVVRRALAKTEIGVEAACGAHVCEGVELHFAIPDRPCVVENRASERAAETGTACGRCDV